MSASASLFGVMIDHWGPKVVCLIGLNFFALGSLLLGQADSNREEVNTAVIKFGIGMSCIAAGGIGVFISSHNIANIARKTNAVASLITMLFQISGLMWWGIRTLLEKISVPVDERRKTIGLIMFYTAISNFVIAWLIWPVQAFKRNSHVENLVSIYLWKGNTNGYCEKSKTETTATQMTRTLLKISHLRERPLKSQLRSKEFFLSSVFFSVFLFSMSYYFATLYSQIEPNDERDWLRTMFLLQANWTPAVLKWPCAVLIRRFGFGFGVGIVCLSSLGMFTTLLSNSVTLFGISTCFFAIYRTFFFYTYFGFVGEAFSRKHYGIVTGFSMICSATFCQFSVVLTNIGFTSGFASVNIVLAVTALIFIPLSFSHVWGLRDRNVAKNVGILKHPPFLRLA